MEVDNSTVTGQEVGKGLCRMFYMVDPAETSFPDMASLPTPYLVQAMPYFFTMIGLEWVVLLLKGETFRVTDGMFSFVHGLIMNIMEAFVSSMLFTPYLYIYHNYCIYPLPWDSTVTWVLAAVGIDFFYYWVHRAHHEINLLWAAHQVHHSSEDYNLTTALRQSAFQTFGGWPFYLPMAFFIPPSHAIVHKELNLLYQFWIHTSVVQSIGPLEYVLNTASHHRVHHGANSYCLDKNYGGALIIWDRMFGTFQKEKEDVEIVYGLVDQPQFWNPLKHQMFYYWKVVEKARMMTTWGDFLSALLKGPGWVPGTERLGDSSAVAQEPVRDKYHPQVSPFLHLYTLPHFALSFIATDFLAQNIQTLTNSSSILLVVYILWTMSNLGMLYDNSTWSWTSELCRCTLSLLVSNHLTVVFSLPIIPLYAVFIGSLVIAKLNY